MKASIDKDIMFFQAIQNILIGFYIRVAYEKKRLHRAQRNKLLKDAIKCYMAKRHYKEIKRDLKGLVIWERQTDFSLECKLLEIYDLAEKHYVSFEENSDVEKLYQSLNHLTRLYNLRVNIIGIDEQKENDTLYLVKSDITEAFDGQGNWLMTKPLRLFTPNDKLTKVFSYFDKTYLETKILSSINISTHTVLELKLPVLCSTLTN